MNKEKEWLTPFESAKLKNTNKQNIYRWVRENKVKSRIITRIVKRIEIKNDEIFKKLVIKEKLKKDL